MRPSEAAADSVEGLGPDMRLSIVSDVAHSHSPQPDVQPVQGLFERNGCPLHYWLTKADAALPWIVFTHGAGVDHGMFDAQWPALQGVRRVLMWDVRGHGLSQPSGAAFTLQAVVDDLVALLDHLGITHATFAGQSMGGNVSQALVQQHPNRVDSLVLIDCACNTFSLSAVERLMLKLTPAILKFYPHERLLHDSAKAAAFTPAAQAYTYEAMKRIPRDELITILQEVTAVLHDDPAYRIPRPFLLIRGEHDNAGAIAKQAPIWAAREPNCVDDVVIPNAGHNSNQDNPAAFNRVLLEFLASQSAARG